MVNLTAPNESVDLFLRLEADPRTNPQIEGVLALLRQKAKLLSAKGARVLTRNEPGNGNLWTLLIAQQSLLSVLGNGLEERGQIEAIYNRLHEWIKCLFGDDSIEKSLSALKPIKSAIWIWGSLRFLAGLQRVSKSSAWLSCRTWSQNASKPLPPFSKRQLGKS